jgi:omega-6 fatty acid desaturase (delta-12 desaturase)
MADGPHDDIPADCPTSAGTELRPAIRRFQPPVLWKSLWQAGSSFAAFVAICAAMYVSLGAPYWLTLGLSVLAAGFVVRIFIIQHDCGHRSFFDSRAANDMLGLVCSLVTLTPYASWRRQHAGHHASWNDLDRRRSGMDIYSTCLTVDEYHALPWWRRLPYRLSRHPLIAIVLLPPLIFLLLYRVPFDAPRTWARERNAVFGTDVALAAMFAGLGLLLGFEQVLLVQLPIMVIASIVGVALFSVQHRFETAVWQRQADWNFQAAALEGSSYLRLPRLLQWFTGNIGFHHIHHLNPLVPNYRLASCHAAIPALRTVPALSLWGGLRSLSLALWDEKRREMIGFGMARESSMDRNPPERRHHEEPDREPARPIEEPGSGGSAPQDDPPPLAV